MSNVIEFKPKKRVKPPEMTGPTLKQALTLAIGHLLDGLAAAGIDIETADPAMQKSISMVSQAVGAAVCLNHGVEHPLHRVSERAIEIDDSGEVNFKWSELR